MAINKGPISRVKTESCYFWADSSLSGIIFLKRLLMVTGVYHTKQTLNKLKLAGNFVSDVIGSRLWFSIYPISTSEETSVHLCIPQEIVCKNVLVKMLQKVILAGFEKLNIFIKQSISVCLQADNDFYEGIRAGKNCSANFPLKFT